MQRRTRVAFQRLGGGQGESTFNAGDAAVQGRDAAVGGDGRGGAQEMVPLGRSIKQQPNAADIVVAAVPVELVTNLGRWKSVAFAEFTRANDPSDKDNAGKDDEAALLEDHEKRGAIKKGSILDMFRPKRVKRDEGAQGELLYSLTWSQPATKNTPPSPRMGHTMTRVGNVFYVFGGNDGFRSYNTVHALDVLNMSWSEKDTTGPKPTPRQRHGAVGLASGKLVIFGGNASAGSGDGEGEIYVLDLMSSVWAQIVSPSADQPEKRWGHSMTLTGMDILVIGGHTGYKALDDFWLLNTITWEWTRLKNPQMTGAIPASGPKHRSVYVEESNKVIVVGGSEANTLKEVHELDVSFTRWFQRDTDGKTPLARSRQSVTLVDRNLFMFGGVGSGQTLKDVTVLNTETCRWSEPILGGKAPSPRMDHTLEVFADDKGTRLFLFGGYDGTQPLNDLHVLLTLTWGELNNKGSELRARVGHTLTVVGDKIYCIGGMTPEGAAGADVHYFDLELGTWQAPLLSGHSPPALVSHSACRLSTDIICFGGGDGRNDGNNLAVFDTEMLMWDLPATEGIVPQYRYGHAAVIVDVRMFVFGGYLVANGYSNGLHVLDTSRLSWSQPFINGMQPSPRVCMSMSVVGRYVFIFGGSMDDVVFADLHILDTKSMTWHQPHVGYDRGLVPIPRYLHSAMTVGHKIYMFGGQTVNQATRMVPRSKSVHWKRHKRGWLIDEMQVLDTIKMAFEHPNIAGKGPGARARHSCTVWDSKIIIHGGKCARADQQQTLFTLDTGVSLVLSDDFLSEQIDPDGHINIAGGDGGGGHDGRQLKNELTVGEWLDQLDLAKYAKDFAEAEININSLMQLDEKDLRDIGVSALGARKKILTAVQNFRQATSGGGGDAGPGAAKKNGSVSGGDNTSSDAASSSASNLYQGRYRIEGFAGYGGTSTVKIATDVATQRKVALKFVANGDDFDHEVEMLRRCRSDYVVDMHDNFRDPMGRAHCIVLDLARTTLQQHVASIQLTRNQQKVILERLARIVGFLHSRNIVHGDLKPSNVCLFGLQWCVVDMATSRPVGVPRSLAVTPLYCSPELAKAISQSRPIRAQPSQDVWTLGVMFLHLFGVQLFQATTLAGLLLEVAEFEDSDLPLERIPDVQAEHLVRKIVRKLPSDRANVLSILSHAFFVGGLDTEQKELAFNYLRTSQSALCEQFGTLNDRVKQLKVQQDKDAEETQRMIEREEKGESTGHRSNGSMVPATPHASTP